MKIVFWSEEAACGTTSNMIATASMIAAKHNCRIAMLSAEKNVHDLVGNFARPDSATVNEECSYYVLEGLDYLLMAGEYGTSFGGGFTAGCGWKTFLPSAGEAYAL